ncbi:hypothetical protein SEA_NICEHOUSE_200 [Rhodococcus phage NiceHouse]|nr:hypothetical protein SEA_NICEHOUSE_200 [Rhodococcus phage NiceHouse]
MSGAMGGPSIQEHKDRFFEKAVDYFKAKHYVSGRSLVDAEYTYQLAQVNAWGILTDCEVSALAVKAEGQVLKSEIFNTALQYDRTGNFSDRLKYIQMVQRSHNVLTPKEIVDTLIAVDATWAKQEANNEQAQGQDSLQLEPRR